MEPYILILVGIGLLVLLVAWLPMLLRELPLSLPIVCVGIGYGVFTIAHGDEPHPLRYPEIAERLTEMLVIVSLTGCGLKLDRAIGWRAWGPTWRLLGIAMPLSIGAVALLGWGLMGLSVGAALLLGAALAPTDPVLASDVQVGPPGSGEEDEVRFSLTSEAGLNDGLAFPFTNLALAVALHTGVATPPADARAEASGSHGEAAGAADAGPHAWFWEWLSVDVGWKLLAGCLVGWAVGRLLAFLTFRLPNPARLSRTGDGFLSLAMTFLSYGLTELAHGYGFLAVFVTAVVFRQAERDHHYHHALHQFAEQFERLFMMVVLVLFGGAVAKGLLDPLTWSAMAAGLLFLFVVRPLVTWICLAGSGHSRMEVAVIGFFGIRGVGSAYYLAYAFNQADWGGMETVIWATVGFVILVSVLLHGTTVTLAMSILDRRRQGSRARTEDQA